MSGGDTPETSEFYYQITFKRGDLNFEFEAPDAHFAQAQYNRWVAYFTDAKIPPVVLKPSRKPAAPSFEQPVQNPEKAVESVTTLPDVNPAEMLDLTADSPTVLNEPDPVENTVDDTTPADTIAVEASLSESTPEADTSDLPLEEHLAPTPDEPTVAAEKPVIEAKIEPDDQFDAFASVLQSALEGAEDDAAPVEKSPLADVKLPFETPSAPTAAPAELTPPPMPEISTAADDVNADNALFNALAQDMAANNPTPAVTAPEASASEAPAELDLSFEALQASTQTAAQGSVFSSLPSSLSDDADIPAPTAGAASAVAPSADNFGALDGQQEFESLQELVELTPTAPGPLDMLLLAAYFLNRVHQQECYSLKELNLELIKSGLTPINHSILEAAVTDGLLTILPDEGESLGATQYSLTPNGLQRVGLLLSPA